MDKFIDNMFNIKNITKAEGLESVQIYIKNQEGKKIFFYLEDYFTQSNLINVNLKNTENLFSFNDIFYLRYNSNNNIKLFCIDPYLKNSIEKYYQELSTIKLDQNDMKNILLKIIVDDKIYIVNIKFNCNIDKKKKKNHNNPFEIKIFFDNNDISHELCRKISSTLSEILCYPEKKIILLEFEIKILISCTFMFLPDKNSIETSKICDKIIDLLFLKNTLCNYDKNFLEIKKKHQSFVNNLNNISYIKIYSQDYLFEGIQINSENSSLYNNDLKINYPQKKNIFKIKNYKDYTKILIQLKNKDYEINFDTNNKETVLKDNQIIIKSNNCYLDFEITKNMENIDIIKSNNTIQVKEVNKFKIEFVFLLDKNATTYNNIFSNEDIKKIKIILSILVVSLLVGLLHRKFTNNNDETFIPEYKINDSNINNEFLNKEFVNSKYQKYYLDKDFFLT